MNRSGIVTVATGHKNYLSLATDLALSVKANSAHPISLLLEPGFAHFRQTPEARFFDQIVDLPHDALGRNLSKLYTAELSPYDVTIYLDADTLVTAPMRDVFARLLQEPAGYLLQGTYLSDHVQEIHNRHNTAELCRRFAVPRYLKANTGIMGFRKREGTHIQAHVRAFATANPDLRPVAALPWISDELCFALCADQLGIRTFEPDQPMYWRMSDIGSEPPSKVVHAIFPDARSLSWLLAYVGHLRRLNNLSPRKGQVAWLRKVLGLRGLPQLPGLALSLARRVGSNQSLV